MSPLRRSDSFRFSAISRFSRLTSEETIHHQPPTIRRRRAAAIPKAIPRLKLGSWSPGPAFLTEGGARLIRIMRTCPRAAGDQVPRRRRGQRTGDEDRVLRRGIRGGALQQRPSATGSGGRGGLGHDSAHSWWPPVLQELVDHHLGEMIASGHPWGREMAGPSWRFVELPTGHWPMFSLPDEVATVLTDLASTSA